MAFAFSEPEAVRLEQFFQRQWSHKHRNVRRLTHAGSLGLYGLRAQEVCNLRRADARIGQATIYVHSVKKGTPRTVQLHPLLHWNLVQFAAHRHPEQHKPLLPTQTGGRIAAKDLRRVAWWWREKLGLDGTFHCLRHTAARRLWENTRSIGDVYQLLGHSTLRVTHVYLQRIIVVDTQHLGAFQHAPLRTRDTLRVFPYHQSRRKA